jgi:hypothetical protein
MAELNREKHYETATGIVGPSEPFFYQNGFMFDRDGVDVTPEVVEKTVDETVDENAAEVADTPKAKKTSKKTEEVAPEIEESSDLI